MKRKYYSIALGLGLPALLALPLFLAPAAVLKKATPSAPAQPQSPEPLTPPPPAAVESQASPYPTQCPAEGQRISVAVYPIKPAGAEPSLASAMTALITSRLSPSPNLRVIEEAMLKAVMERQAMNMSDLCDDTVCQVEIGKLVQAQKLITGDLVKFGSKYILSLKLIDIQTGTTEFATEDKCSCPEDQLDQLVEVAAAKVRHHFCDQVSHPPLPPAGSSAAELEPIPWGKARIYIFLRMPDDQSQAAIQEMLPNQCMVMEADPGVETFGHLNFQVEAGKTYFIEASWVNAKPQGWISASLVPEAQGRQWAQNCKRPEDIQPPEPKKAMKKRK